MPRPIRDAKTGQLRGSVGDGKVRVPGPRDALVRLADPAPDDRIDEALSDPYACAFEQFSALADDDTLAASVTEIADRQARREPPRFQYEELREFGASAMDAMGTLVLESPENTGAFGAYAGRSGSTDFEKDFAVPILTSEPAQPALREAIEASVPGNRFQFIRVRRLLEESDPDEQKIEQLSEAEAKDRLWADLMIDATYDGQPVWLPVNLKATKAPKTTRAGTPGAVSAGNLCGWQGLAWALFGDYHVGAGREARPKFFQAVRERLFADARPSDYFVLDFAKGVPSSDDPRLTTGFSHTSVLDATWSPVPVIRFNSAQSVPLQINTSLAAEARRQSGRPRSLLQRRKEFSEWLMTNMRDAARTEYEATTAALDALAAGDRRRSA